MEKKFRTKSKKRSIIFCSAIGLLAAMIVSVLLAAFAAILISNESLSESLIKTVGIVTMAISAFISVQIGGRMAVEKKVLAGACAAAGYYLALAALTILFFEGRFIGFGAGTIAFAVGCGTSVLVLVIPAGRGLKRRKRVFSR